ncbi:hypothetical protein CSB11_02510 [Candidatus Campbellbacteria bacterium]|nr:MAG: hypothetical protein CSB11_02510 [Candidatus Campbellbacteria bacterium]
MTEKEDKIILIDACKCLLNKDNINEDLKEILNKYSYRKIILSDVKLRKEDENKINKSLTGQKEIYVSKKSLTKTNEEYYDEMLQYFNLQAKNCIYIEHDPLARIKALESGILSLPCNIEEDNKLLESGLAMGLLGRLPTSIEVFDFSVKNFIKNISIGLVDEIKIEYLMVKLGVFYENKDYMSYFIYVIFVFESLLSENLNLHKECLKRFNKIYSNSNINVLSEDFFKGNLTLGKKIDKFSKLNHNNIGLEDEVKKMRGFLEKRNNIFHNFGRDIDLSELKGEIQNKYSWNKFYSTMRFIQKINYKLNEKINIDKKIYQLMNR